MLFLTVLSKKRFYTKLDFDEFLVSASVDRNNQLLHETLFLLSSFCCESLKSEGREKRKRVERKY